MLVGQRPMKSLLSICPSLHPSVSPSVRLSVHPSLSFLKIGSLVFSDIVHEGNWPWYLVTDTIRFLGKNEMAARIWAKWAKFWPETRFFCYFLKFCSLVFLEVAYNDSLQQVEVSLTEKIFGDQIWLKQAKIRAKISWVFLPFSHVWFICFPLNCIGW